MGVFLETVKIFDQLRDTPTENTSFLRDDIGSKIRVEVEFYVENIAVANTDNAIVLVPSTSQSGITATTRWIWSEDSSAFQDFYVGDKIKITGVVAGSNALEHTIVQKIGNDLIKVDKDLTNESVPDGDFVYLTTAWKGVDYAFNFLENNSATSFQNIIDGEESRAKTNLADATDVVTNIPMPYQGKTTYQSGSCTIIGRGTVLSKQYFTLTHNTVVTPTHLAGQYSDTVSGIKPSYYDAGECLKYLFRIRANRDGTNPNDFQEVIYDEADGNSGWWNENYNGGATNYSISDVVITRVSDAQVLTALDLNNECGVTFNVNNTVDTPFSASESNFAAIFSHLPDDVNNYTNNTRTFEENFVYDNAYQIIDTAAVNGDTFGTTYQVFKDVTGAFVNSGRISISLKVDIGSAGVTQINLNTFKRYLLAISVGERLRTYTDYDKVNLIVNINEFFNQLTTTDLIEDDHLFIQHPYTSRVDGVTALDSFPVDDIAANTDFTIDFTDKLSDGIIIKSITSRVIARKSGEADIVLESNTADTSASPLVGGLVPAISFLQQQGFKIAVDSIRTDWTIERETSLDSGNIYGWNINYPFFDRWEYWKSIGFLASPPTGIYDTAEPLNGLNHFWHRYDTVTGWDIYYQLEFLIEQNGQTFSQDFEYQFNTYDYNSNGDWINEEIKSFDIASGLEITNAGTKYIYGYENVRIEASFENSGSIPDIADLEGVIWIETKEQGGIKDIRRASTVYDIDSNSWFKAITGTKVEKSIASNTITFKVLVDYSKLPTNTEYTIYARLYDKSPLGIGRLLQDDEFRLLQDDEFRLLQDQ